MHRPLLLTYSAIVLIALTTSSSHGQKPLQLPVPDGWRVENTSYPPPWARTLPWKGTLQLRFPKGFFDAKSDFFWSYPILYQLKGDVIKTDEELQRALLEYDAGLYDGRYPKNKITMDVVKNPKPSKAPLIIVDGYDPFTTKMPLRTWIQFHRRYDKQNDLTIILLLRSAQSYSLENPVWQELQSFRKSVGF